MSDKPISMHEIRMLTKATREATTAEQILPLLAGFLKSEKRAIEILGRFAPMNVTMVRGPVDEIN
jgi:hypothetical protein